MSALILVGIVVSCSHRPSFARWRFLGYAIWCPTLGAIVRDATNVGKISTWSSTVWFFSLFPRPRFLGYAILGPTLGEIVRAAPAAPRVCHLVLPGPVALFDPARRVVLSRQGSGSGRVWHLSPGE